MKKLFALAVLISCLSSQQLMAQTQDNCDIIIKDNKFNSGKLSLSKDTKECNFDLKSDIEHKITICNKGNVAVEFESKDLHREKVIKPQKSVTVNIGPLQKGKTYKFFEEFHGHKCSFRAI